MNPSDSAESSETLVTDAAEKPMSRFQRFCQSQEFLSLCIALSALIAMVALCVVCAFIHNGIRLRDIGKILVTHLIGGAAFGVTKGATYPEFTLLENLLLNSLLTVTLIFFFNTLFSLSCKKVLHIPFLEKTFGDMQNSAKGQRRKWANFGIPGIYLFVLLPMTSTGPLVGSVLGRLIGLGFWTNLITVTSGSISTILIAGFAAEKLNQYVPEKTMAVAIWIFIGCIVAFALIGKLVFWLRKKKLNKLLPLVALSAGLFFFSSCASLADVNCAAPPAPTSLIQIDEATFGGPLPAPLSKYVTQWKQWHAEATKAAPATANHPPSLPNSQRVLPASPAQLAFTPTRYKDTLVMLLEAMATPTLTTNQKYFLESVALTHQQQTLLANFYGYAEEVRRGKKESLLPMLSTLRLLKAVTRNFRKDLPLNAADVVIRDLDSWMSLWDRRSPISIMPTLWIPSTSPTPPKKLSNNSTQPIHFAASFDELPLANPFPKAKTVWLHQELQVPVVAEGRTPCLILPPLPKGTKVILNGKKLPHNKPITLHFPPSTTLNLAIALPPHSLGTPPLPPTLASTIQ